MLMLLTALVREDLLVPSERGACWPVGWCIADGKLLAFCSSPRQLLTLLQGGRGKEKGPKMQRRRVQEWLQPNSKKSRWELLKILLDPMDMSGG